MNSCALDKSTIHNPAARFIENNIRHHRNGLTHNEVLVLAALVEIAALVPGEPLAAISRYELADRIESITWSQAQRLLTKLTKKGLIARRQNAKLSGEVAVTVVSDAAFKLFDMDGGARIGQTGLPAEFSELIIGESEAFIAALLEAYESGQMLPMGTCSDFRGGSRRLAQIEFLLAGQMEALRMAAMIAAAELEAEAEAADRGLHVLTLSNGESVHFDQRAFQEVSEGEEIALRGANLEFAKDVIERIDLRSPGKLTAKIVPRLAAEILFSRQKGFVWRHDYADACRVLASVISRGGWNTPSKMPGAWYSIINKAVSAGAAGGHAQGVRQRAS